MYGVADLEAATEAEIQEAWHEFLQDKVVFDQFKRFYTPRSEIVGSGSVKYIRSFIVFGAPLNIDGIRFNDVTDRTAKQLKYVADF